MIVRLASGRLKTKFGDFLEILYYDGQQESIALIMGDIKNCENILCRVHSNCLSAHTFNSIECDCREQMEMAQHLISNEGKGLIIWLNQEGKGNGHFALISTAELRYNGMSQTNAYRKLGFKEDCREYSVAAKIIKELEVLSIILLTNNPTKISELQNNGITISRSERLVISEIHNNILLDTYRGKIAADHIIDMKKIKISDI